MRMLPLTEESSLQSPVATTPTGLPVEEQETDTLQPPPPAIPRPENNRGILRRTSQAALNRFSRNRASTVTGAPPTLARENSQRMSEYGPHVVDVLDVIGKLDPLYMPRAD